MKNKLILAALPILLLCTPAAVQANSMDYTSLQEVFGEPVTTSATGKPQRVSDAPVTMEILTHDDIRKSGAINIPEVLRTVNGVNVVQKGPTTYDVSIRGYTQHQTQRLLVLINGRQVYLDHYGYTDWATLPVQLAEIEQIEIVKGPNTALFGFNAVNGVINIVTLNPKYDKASEVGTTIGSNGYQQGHYIQNLNLNDHISTRVSASLLRSDNFDNNVNSAPSMKAGDPTGGYFSPRQKK